MQNKKVLVYGCGSIGMRHARLAAEAGASVLCVSSKEDLPFPSVRSLVALDEGSPMDLGVIATPTALHGQHIRALLDMSVKFLLVEKPLFASLAESGSLQTEDDRRRIRVAYNLRFHPGLLRLRGLLRGQQLLALQLHVGQYLPSWRPNQDYRRSYSASHALGGGVLRDLSHELDLACLLAGRWQRVAALGGKVSDLEITSDDSFTLLTEHEHCPQVSIHLDYLQTPARREIVAVVQDGSLRLDLITGTLTCGNTKEQFQVARDDTYRNQLRAILDDDLTLCCAFSEGFDVVTLIDAAESAAKCKEWIWRDNQ